MGKDTTTEDEDQTFWESLFATVKELLFNKIKTPIFNWIWDRTWDFVCGVLYQRSANQQSAQSLPGKETTIQNALNELLELSGYSHLALAQKVSKVTEKSTNIRTYLGKTGIWTYLQQCSRSKVYKKQLEEINEEFDETIRKSDELISNERSNKKIQQEITKALYAVSCQNHGIGTNPGGPVPLPVTDLKAWPDLDGSIVLKLDDTQNGLLGYQVCYDSFSKDHAPVFVAPSSKFISLNDPYVKPWMTYEPAVRAVNARKPGDWVHSTPSKVLNKSIPSTPLRPEFVGPTSDTSIEISVYRPEIQKILSCVVSTNDSDPRPVPFTRMNGDFGIIKLSLENLSPTSTYQVRLKFRNEHGISKTYSDELQVKMSSFSPGAPVGVSVSERKKNKAYIRWSKPSSNEDLVDSYEIEKMDESWVNIATVPASTYTYVASLPDIGSDAHFRVRSVSSNGFVSEYSQVVTLKKKSVQVVQVKPSTRKLMYNLVQVIVRFLYNPDVRYFLFLPEIKLWENIFIVLPIYVVISVALFMDIGWLAFIWTLLGTLVLINGIYFYFLLAICYGVIVILFYVMVLYLLAISFCFLVKMVWWSITRSFHFLIRVLTFIISSIFKFCLSRYKLLRS